MKKGKHIFWELALILGSVLVFRGLWELMDKVPFLKETGVLVLSVIVGVILTIAGYYKIVHADK